MGPFMTSLDMHGLSLSLLRIPDDATLALLDAPTQARAAAAAAVWRQLCWGSCDALPLLWH